MTTSFPDATYEGLQSVDQGFVDVSQTYKNDGFDAAEALAGDVIDGAYAYELGAVAFKPTWASAKPRSEPAGMVPFPILSVVMTTSTISASASATSLIR